MFPPRSSILLPEAVSVLLYSSAVAENQPANKHRMHPELSHFAARLRASIDHSLALAANAFSELALELFALQFQANPAYQQICCARQRTPETVLDWRRIPTVPTSAFKELELTSLAPAERTAVFHSSGTTEQRPSRHFHSAESLALYEASLGKWFEQKALEVSGFRFQVSDLLVLTPPPVRVPHSSLVHMFATIWRPSGGASLPASRPPFFGQVESDGAWTLELDSLLAALTDNSKLKTQNSKLILGTAFSFVHLLDNLVEKNVRLTLPAGSRVLETGGYKNRSRSLPKAALHELIIEYLGVPRENILCEYGMSELSSQAYASAAQSFHFPPWARVQIISPETGREVAEGETGLIRILDLANVFSVAAIQTEDLGIRRGDGFELVGRAQFAGPRGCSLMVA